MSRTAEGQLIDDAEIIMLENPRRRSRRRRSTRRGGMPAGLKRYWAAKRSRRRAPVAAASNPPARRRRRRRSYAPVHRRRSYRSNPPAFNMGAIKSTLVEGLKDVGAGVAAIYVVNTVTNLLVTNVTSLAPYKAYVRIAVAGAMGMASPLVPGQARQYVKRGAEVATAVAIYQAVLPYLPSQVQPAALSGDNEQELISQAASVGAGYAPQQVIATGGLDGNMWNQSPIN